MAYIMAQASFPKAPAFILASGSAARQTMLRQAGYHFAVQSAAIDETALIQSNKDKNPEDIAGILATEKAKNVSKSFPDEIIVGCDQILFCNGRIFEKAATRQEAREKLKILSGQTHQLISAVSFVRNSEILAAIDNAAFLTMKSLSDNMINTYLDSCGATATACVGAYALEGLGIHLFEKIEGDYFTILGLPLLSFIKTLESLTQE